MSKKDGIFEDNKPIKVGIIGYGNIGKVHCKILNKFGANINSVICSSFESGIKASKNIHKLYGYKPKTFINIKNMINTNKPDCIFICTPPERHFNDIINSLQHRIPIFCEKPLIWSQKCKKEKIIGDLNTIKQLKKSNIFCNYANNNLLESLIKKARITKNINYFKFLFHTNGIYRNRNIGVDLLPHGIAMLTHLIGNKYKIKNYIEKFEKNKFRCSFKFKDIEVFFDFAQSNFLKKKFQIQLNKRRFTRNDNNEKNGIYKVWFNENGKTYLMDNPFETEVVKFLRVIKNENTTKDNFIEAFNNTKILSDILLK